MKPAATMDIVVSNPYVKSVLKLIVIGRQMLFFEIVSNKIDKFEACETKSKILSNKLISPSSNHLHKTHLLNKW